MKLASGAKFKNRAGHFYHIVSAKNGMIRARVRKGPRGPYGSDLVEMKPADFRGMTSVE